MALSLPPRLVSRGRRHPSPPHAEGEQSRRLLTDKRRTFRAPDAKEKEAFFGFEFIRVEFILIDRCRPRSSGPNQNAFRLPNLSRHDELSCDGHRPGSRRWLSDKSTRPVRKCLLLLLFVQQPLPSLLGEPSFSVGIVTFSVSKHLQGLLQ